MNNGDMPAMPQDYVLWCEGIGKCPTEGIGLTKREMFAKDAPSMPSWFVMKFVSDPSLNKGIDYMVVGGDSMSVGIKGEEVAYMAWPVYYADALLSQLQEEKG